MGYGLQDLGQGPIRVIDQRGRTVLDKPETLGPRKLQLGHPTERAYNTRTSIALNFTFGVCTLAMDLFIQRPLEPSLFAWLKLETDTQAAATSPRYVQQGSVK